MTSTNGKQPAPPTDGERLLGLDITVPLAGGESPPLVYDFRAWVILEAEYGGLSAIAEHLSWGAPHWVEEWVEEDQLGPEGVEKTAVVRKRLVVPEAWPVLEDLHTFLAAGLAHAGLSKEEVGARMLMAELHTYKEAVSRATDLAWPGQQPAPAEEGAEAGAEAAAGDSAGEGGQGKAAPASTETASTGPASTT